MTQAPSKGFFLVALIAVGFHGALFFAVQPKRADMLAGGMPVPPRTFFMAAGGEDLPMVGMPVRTIISPVLFSLPSSVGFSRVLYDQKIQTPRFTPNPGSPEQFLEAHPVPPEMKIESKRLMLTSVMAGAPDVPDYIYGADIPRPSARRVTLAPVLKERLIGGVVLPSALNQDVENAWEVSAQLSVSDEGVVKQVFLKNPQESAVLNMEILKLLYGLQFNAGEPVDGVVEIYSPEPTKSNGEAEE